MGRFTELHQSDAPELIHKRILVLRHELTREVTSELTPEVTPELTPVSTPASTMGLIRALNHSPMSDLTSTS